MIRILLYPSIAYPSKEVNLFDRSYIQFLSLFIHSMHKKRQDIFWYIITPITKGHRKVELKEIKSKLSFSNTRLINVDIPKNPFNRIHFNIHDIKRELKLNEYSIDFIFCHQPEMLYNILVSYGDKRYGQNMNRFLFFHWVDCTQSRASSAIPPAYMRQLEAINMCDNVFFHTDIASDWLGKNYRNEQSTEFNHQFVKDKTKTFPISADKLPDGEPFDIKYDNVLVFNHRWAKSTGVNRMMEYMEGLYDYKPDFKIKITDVK